jgi:DNA-binding NtrC family response regulator
MPEKTPQASVEPNRVLIVEDDSSLAELLEEEITEIGFRARSAKDVECAITAMRGWIPDLVISDLRLPGADGLDLLRHSRNLSPAPSFIVITAFGTVAQAVDALRQGADDFLTKPLDLDHLRLSVSRVLEKRRLQQQLVRYQEILGDEGFHGLIGRSRPMQRLFSQIRQVACGSGPVLIVGESGVGKELVARAIHRESDRSRKVFLPVNCAGIPENLMESEFFGHAAGAFTGASRPRKGLFVEADGGTLLLDEIAEMPLPLQAKLLRILQEGTVRAVGTDVERRVDVRILAATNRDLETEVRSGALREDLFYRLETFTLNIPPLREREDDLELLTGRFVRRFATQMNRQVRGMQPEALERLRTYPFPGNVRELQNAIERAVTFCDGSVIKLGDLPPRIYKSPTRSQKGFPGALNLPKSVLDDGALPSLAELEARYIHHVVEQVGGNKRRAATLLGIGRRTLYRRLGEAPPEES